MNRGFSLLIKQWLTPFFSLLWQMGVAGCVFALMLVITEGNPSGIVVAIVFCLTVVLIASLEAARQWFEAKDTNFYSAFIRFAFFPVKILTGPRPSAPSGASLHETSPPETHSYRGNFYVVNFYRANLQRANFYRANLRSVYFYKADLRSVYFYKTDLQRANFYRANLSGAFLRGTYLREAHFVEAILSGADLEGADLKGADLQKANLLGANLEGAYFQGTIVIKTIFGSNTGLSESDKANLRARGAIFEDPTDSDL